eukprot:SM000092S24523  [mRNA]  locus=s92:407382:410929:+ [translate_table: standard]
MLVVVVIIVVDVAVVVDLFLVDFIVARYAYLWTNARFAINPVRRNACLFSNLLQNPYDSASFTVTSPQCVAIMPLLVYSLLIFSSISFL